MAKSECCLLCGRDTRRKTRICKHCDPAPRREPPPDDLDDLTREDEIQREVEEAVENELW